MDVKKKYFFLAPCIISDAIRTIKKPEAFPCFGFSVSKLAGIISLRVFLK